MFKIGDKVRLTKEEIDYYWKNKDLAWVEAAPEIFASGRVFTVTKVEGEQIELDGEETGFWDEESLIKHEYLPGDLFEI